jgi:gliding motility-associated-like protein
MTSLSLYVKITINKRGSKTMKKIFLILCMVCAYVFSQAQCIQINEEGIPTITIASASDGTTIQRQEGDTWIDAGVINNGTFVDSFVDASTKSINYRIANTSGSGDEYTYFSTIYCEASTNSTNTAVVDITWTAQSTATSYKIYRLLTGGDEFLYIADVTSNQTSYQTTKPNDCEILYKVEAIAAECSSYSNIATLMKSDNEAPNTPGLNPIDVDLSTQKVVISWQQSTNADTKGYVVCRLDENSTRQPLDTIYGATNTSYTCEKCSIKDINKITIFAFDNCNNTSPNSQMQCNMVLSADRSNCTDPLHLSWNKPDENNTEHNYEIFMATDEDMNYKSVGTTTNLYYDAQLPDINGSVYFYVKCGNRSNTTKTNVALADTLDYVYVEGVSISDDNLSATVSLSVDASKKVSGYKLYRKMDNEDFQEVQNIEYSGAYKFDVIDALPFDASEHTYTYYLAAPDICGGNYTYSNRLTSMKLEVDATNPSKIKLSWNPFKPTDWRVLGYEIYRYEEGDFENAEYVTRTVASSYTDDVEEFLSATDRIYYYVRALSNLTNDPTVGAFGCNSSSAFAKFESTLFVPSAFSPKDGRQENLRFFKPSCLYVRAGTYKFKVFNRAGTVLFETTDTDQGWDGKYKGEYCPVGVYVYEISYIDSDGMQQYRGGQFLLYD